MPPRRRAKSRPNAVHSYDRLEHRLTLLSWLHERLGYESTKSLLEGVKSTNEGFDGDGHSYVYRLLASRDERLNEVTTADLERYDDNIREHLAGMNAGRTQPITLRYFQYLAALYAEIFLDRWRESPARLLDSLNRHVVRLNIDRGSSGRVEPYQETDLKKLAFWMATGSGKTLLMHLNYRQYLQYNSEPLDNILLITPTEDLTRQHLDELRESGIPGRRFDLNERRPLGTDDNTVQVIEITKLVTEKSG